jgi:cellulose synthase/poly-beta-1,6-N-acetylglucosamine synthase-like glycosyltransferase
MAFAIAYVFLISYISDGWDQTIEWKTPPDYLPESPISIIIPVRNEENHLPQLIRSLLNNDFPIEKREILVINDHSTDDTKKICNPYVEQITWIDLPAEKKGKKRALEMGIKQAKFEKIICLDGDGKVGDKYLQTVSSYLEIQNVKFVTGLVKTPYKEGIFQSYQFLDLAGNMFITAGGIHHRKLFLANGANMAFLKSDFLELGGFNNNTSFASGDDMFLIQKFANVYPDKIRFLKSIDSVVTTKNEPSIGTLIQQRKRWATKVKAYANQNLVKVQIFIALIQIWIIGMMVGSLWTGGFTFFCGLFLLFIKWVMDYLLVAKVSRYYGQTKPLKYFMPAAILQFLIYGYSAISVIIGKKYVWKGRSTQ